MSAAPDTLSATVELASDDWTIQTRLTVPAGPTRGRDLLPLFQSLSDAIVGAAVHVVTEGAGREVSCKKGCGACCRMLVPISQIEARHLRDLVEALPEPRRSTVRERFADARRRLEAAGLMEQLHHADQLSAEENTALTRAYFDQRIPCPFLEEESCSIHSDRPITCREYLVTSPPELCASRTPPQSVNRVRIPLHVLNAVARLETPGGRYTYESWVPLVLAPEWADAHPDESPPRPGPAVLREFLDHLSRQRTDQ
jgi:Fe-S-cluster containining protein